MFPGSDKYRNKRIFVRSVKLAAILLQRKTVKLAAFLRILLQRKTAKLAAILPILLQQKTVKLAAILPILLQRKMIKLAVILPILLQRKTVKLAAIWAILLQRKTVIAAKLTVFRWSNIAVNFTDLTNIRMFDFLSYGSTTVYIHGLCLVSCARMQKIPSGWGILTSFFSYFITEGRTELRR